MKTKEDILEEHFERGKIMQVKDEYIDDYGVHDFIYEAMDEYAQQQAILYAQWRTEYKREEQSRFLKAKKLGIGAKWLADSDGTIYAQFIENQKTPTND